MESLLEIQRRSHEERERLVKVMVDEFMDKKTNDKDKIFSDHRVKIFLDVSKKHENKVSPDSDFILDCSNTWRRHRSWLISMKTKTANEKQKLPLFPAQMSSQNFTPG